MSLIATNAVSSYVVSNYLSKSLEKQCYKSCKKTSLPKDWNFAGPYALQYSTLKEENLE